MGRMGRMGRMDRMGRMGLIVVGGGPGTVEFGTEWSAVLMSDECGWTDDAWTQIVERGIHIGNVTEEGLKGGANVGKWAFEGETDGSGHVRAEQSSCMRDSMRRLISIGADVEC